MQCLSSSRCFHRR